MCHVRSKYEGMLAVACYMDAERHIVPLAIAYVPGEDEDIWRYFSFHLKRAIGRTDDKNLVMSDRDKGLRVAQRAIYPLAIPAICAKHLERNINAKFKSTFNVCVWLFAIATTKLQFDEAMLLIKSESEEAYICLVNSEPSTWATAHFPLPRFGIYTGYSAESSNSMFKELRNGSYLNIMIGPLKGLIRSTDNVLDLKILRKILK